MAGPEPPAGDDDERRRRFLALLAPLHDRARLTARRLCRSNADGDDLFQEAALRALLRLDDLRDAGRFRAWFYAVLLSVHRERSRRSFWRRFVPFLDDAEPPDPAPEPTERRGLCGQLTRALLALPAEQREAVVLFEVDGYSLEEVAELQGASVVAVKSRLFRGRRRLRRHYTDLTAADDARIDDDANRDAATAPPLGGEELGHDQSPR